MILFFTFLLFSVGVSCHGNQPNPPVVYNDLFMRTQQLTLASASHNDNPQNCFDNQIPTLKLHRLRVVNCSADYSDVTCTGYTAYDITQKVIVLSFRGSKGTNQNNQIFGGMETDGLKSYFGQSRGQIFTVLYDSFILLWKGGMMRDILFLKLKYPKFDLWVNGHSFGGDLSWVASSYLVTRGLFNPRRVKVVAFGSPRIGDLQFAEWYSSTFPDSFHIVHRKDLIPRVPQIDPHTNVTAVFQPRTEVWYNNYMTLQDSYHICEGIDGSNCSSSVQEDLTWNDHGYYFNVNIPTWGKDGCPQNITGYAQP